MKKYFPLILSLIVAIGFYVASIHTFGVSMAGGAIAAIIGVVATKAATAALAGSISSSLMLSLVSSAIGLAVSYGLRAAFGLRPKSPSIAGAAEKVTTRKSSRPYVTVYGKARVGSNIVYLHNSWNELLVAVYTFCHHEVDSVEEIFFNKRSAWTPGGGTTSHYTSYYTYISVWKGATSGAGLYDTLLSDYPGVGERGPHLNTNWKSYGITSAIVRHNWSHGRYPGGFPTVTALIKGKKVYNFATGTTIWSDNPVDILYDYLVNHPAGPKVASSKIDTSSFQTAAAICDESVSLEGGGTEKRYRCSAVFDEEATPKEVIENILDTFNGKLVKSNGTWKVYAGKWVAPTVTITDNDIHDKGDGWTLNNSVPKRERVTRVTGRFYDENSDYELVTYPDVVSSTLETRYGEAIPLSKDYLFVPSVTQAQRLAKQMLLLSQRSQILTLSVPFKFYDLQVGDIITINSSLLGVNTTYEIQEMLIKLDNFTLELTVKEVAQSDYSWSSSEEGEYTPAPPPTLPDPDAVPTLTVSDITIEGI